MFAKHRVQPPTDPRVASMRLIENRTASSGVVTVELTQVELRLIYGVLAQVNNGPNAYDDPDWDMLIGIDRKVEAKLLNDLDAIIQTRT